MTDIDRLEQRLSAVERTVVDGDYELTELSELTSLAEDIEALESRLDSLEQRFAELEASAQATQGYVSNIQSVNEDVEQQADAAIAAVNRLEERIGTFEETLEHQRAGSESTASSASDDPASGSEPPTNSFSPEVDPETAPSEPIPSEQSGADDEPDPSPVSAADQASIEESVGQGRADERADQQPEDDGILSSLVAKLPP